MIRLLKHVRFSSSQGQNVKGFSLKDSIYSPDYKMNLHKYEHQKTGAHIYHIENNDSNNAYASIIKTLPVDDKGCPHILEHIVCCGSQKYPVRDPFFNMLRRSVNSYMNAWTGQDFTCYPFSSPNQQDWNNLYNVYLDLSLKPLVNELDFRQEGWRFEFNQKNQKELKGIVLNEMKGSYQSAERQLMVTVGKNLLDNTPYSFDSGGVPSQIVKLSYQQLKNMQKHYYHPSNMAFYFYGNNQLTSRLQNLNQNYLSKYSMVDYKHNSIVQPKLLKSSQTIFSSTIESNNISLSYYLGNLQQISEVDKMCLKVISYILLQTNQAELYKTYIENKDAETFGYSGFNFGKLLSFGVTLRGIKDSFTKGQFYNKFNEVVYRLGQQGLPEKRVNQVMYQYEMSTLIPKANNGLRILQTALPIFNHRAQLTILTHPIKILKQAREKLLSVRSVRDLIDKYFINNKHYTIVEQIKKEESQSVSDKEFQPLEIEQKKIREQQQKLTQRQSTPEDTSILPILKIEQILDMKYKTFKRVQQFQNAGRKFRHYHIGIDEDINFYRFAFRISNLNDEILRRIALWQYTINKGIGAGPYDAKQLAGIISSISVGFSVSVIRSENQDSIYIMFGATCLKKDKQKLFEIMEMIILDPKYQPKNMEVIFASYQNDVKQSLVESPMQYCMDLCSSKLNKRGLLFNSFFQAMEGLKVTKEGHTSFHQFTGLLKNCDSIQMIQHSNVQSSEKPEFIEKILTQTATRDRSNIQFDKKIESVAVTHQYDVNFCAQQYLGPKYLSEDYANLSLFLDILQQQYLHPEIREKGGAYGARAVIRSNQLICLYSYMDPQPQRTFKTFQKSIDELLNDNQVNEQMLLEAKISQFGSIDKPRAPQSECVAQILEKCPKEKIQKYREVIKGAKLIDVLSAGRAYLWGKQHSRVLFGNAVPQGFQQQKLKFE